MPHQLITGKTMSGKTTLAKLIARHHKKNGRMILALDSMWDAEIKRIADWTTDDPEKFLAVARANTSATLLVDEGGTTVGRYAQHMECLATQYRHLGHLSLFCVQRPMQIALTIRVNTVGLWLFACSGKDAKGLAEDYGCDELRAAPSFEPGEFICYRSFAKPFRGNVFKQGRAALGLK